MCNLIVIDQQYLQNNRCGEIDQSLFLITEK
jgi:hypothetical protein